MPAPKVRAVGVDLRVSDCDARLPFRFGAATITWAPLVTARVRADLDGEAAVGFAADLMMPRWFDKTPGRTVAEDVTALARSCERAARAFERQPAAALFDVWLGAYRALQDPAGVALVTGFGAALVERALMDAVCRAAGVSFHDALRSDLFGFAPGRVHAELEAWDLAASLPAAPLERVLVRHTIGLLDPLRADDVDAAHRVGDGLPECLEDDVRRFGLSCFKVKVGGAPESDARRLADLGELLPALCGDGYLVTLDANEQYADLDALRKLLDGVPPELARRIEYVEQPFPRAATFEASVAGLGKPVIIDEADGDVGSFPAALALGYAGVSVKNCKGVFRALLNRGLSNVRRGAFQSAEDLTNLPVLSLQQDLATVATLGLPHVERNGHHYFRGLAHLPRDEARSALARHPDLYEERDGGVFLRIEDGALNLRSLACPGYGVASEIDFEARTPLEDWRPRAERAS